ncbi:MAG: hypothetical protein ACRC6B_08130, partial [Fusobacteriaceae bacterium]
DQTTISGAMAFRINNGTDNYIRYCSSPASIRTWLGAAAIGGDASYVKKAGDTMTGTLTGKHITATGTGNDYHTGGFEVCGNGSSNTVFPTYGFHQPGLFAASIQARSGTDIRFYAQGAGAYTDITARSIYANGTFTSTASGITSRFGALNASHTHFETNAGSFHFNKDTRIQGNIYCGPSYNQLVWSTNNLAFGTGASNMATGNHTHTPAQVGLGNVANYGHSNAIGDNSTARYATTNMVAQVRAEKINKAGDTMTGVLTLKSPGSSTVITSTTTNASLKFGGRNTGNTAGTYFMPMTQISAQHGQGYNTHVTTGIVKNGYGSGWGDGVSGFFVGTGGSDSNPTQYFTLAHGGKIKHSNGHEFYSTSFKPNATDVGLGNVPNTAHTAAATASTVVLRDSSADITCRLVRSNYVDEATPSGGLVFRKSVTDNYLRTCNNTTNLRNWLGAAPTSHTHAYIPTSGNATVTTSIIIGGANRDGGMMGTYDSYKTQSIWSMGNAYRNNAAGTNFGTLYGLAYKHTNNTTGGTMAGGHQMVWCANGVGKSAMGDGIWTSGNITGAKTYNAVWNDYAEYFPKREGYVTEAGDIIALSQEDDEEIYVLATENHDLIVGAHSDQYGHLIGGEEPAEGLSYTEHNDSKYIPVGLVGRLPVKFIGIARKGMKVVPSHIPGVGRAFDNSKDNYDKVIGYIVENNDEEGIRRVKIKIGK